jgi:SAM-dependent methyltransferase
VKNHRTAEDLIRFVKQSDNVPNARWFLRKIEWAWSLRYVGKPANRYSMVLDLASEIRVSHSLFKRGWKICRVDLSQESAAEARKQGPEYCAHIVVDPSQPKLPFHKNLFEAAISIGPFDFQFLDIDVLLEEVKTILGLGGRFVFSLPTLKSPYCHKDSIQKFRFWSPENISHIIRQWKVGDNLRTNIPQPAWVYSRIGNTSRIPALLFDVLITYPILSLCPILPDSYASYVVFSFLKRSHS